MAMPVRLVIPNDLGAKSNILTMRNAFTGQATFLRPEDRLLQQSQTTIVCNTIVLAQHNPIGYLDYDYLLSYLVRPNTKMPAFA